MSTIEPIRWHGDRLELLDQRRLPAETLYLNLSSAAEVADAIRDMVVRGAPAIGISAAYGAALAARHVQPGDGSAAAWQQALAVDLQRLADSRPTAVNLFWALAQAREVIARGGEVAAGLADLAVALHRDDRACCAAIGQHGAALLGNTARIYTHCNTGALATGGDGTALAVIRAAHRNGQLDQVYAGETRPWWQGARLTAWELQHDNIPFALCVDGAAGHLMQSRGINWVVVGADRISANGDTANKIGTYNLAVLARHHGARFMVAAPSSTFDLSLDSGSDIPIEERPATEITELRGEPLAAPGCAAINPAFDITPAGLIDVIVTERGVISQPDRARIAHHLCRG